LKKRKYTIFKSPASHLLNQDLLNQTTSRQIKSGEIVPLSS
jgi:hypothetical protein